VLFAASYDPWCPSEVTAYCDPVGLEISEIIELQGHQIRI